MVVDDTIGISLLFASFFKEKPGNYILVASNLYSAQKSYEFLLNFLDEDEVIFFPSDELLRAEQLSSSKEFLSQRLYAMSKALEKKNKIIVAHPTSLLRFLPDPEQFKKNQMILKVGDQIDIEEFKSKMIELGYTRVNKIDQTLQFAIRGDIIDFYSVGDVSPTRIELFGDEIESIKTFDIASQSSRKKIESAKILPASDIFLSDDELTDFALRLKNILATDKDKFENDEAEELEKNVMNDLSLFVEKNYRPYLYKYYGFALNKCFSIVDYLDNPLVYIASKDSFSSSYGSMQLDSRHYLNELFEARLCPSHLENYMKLEQAVKDDNRLKFGLTFAKEPTDIIANIHHIIPSGNGLNSVIPTIMTYYGENKKVIISLPDLHQNEVIRGILEEKSLPYEEVDGFNLPKGNLGISYANLNHGFEINECGITYISSSELFGHSVAASRFTSRFKEATILRTYDDLIPGDYVVHEYNGIGQFLGVKTLEDKGKHRDYLYIAYAGEQKLYIPLEQFRLVRKYSAKDGAAPRLSRLFSKEWENRKKKIKERVNELAERLLTLYGDRAKTKGFAFLPDDEIQTKFENEFPYALTEDQEKSLQEIKADMEKDEIMDRLLIGDVGFGKTELAFRACMKCILSGKQAAILCPTTLLARQHYEVALSRFASFGVKIVLFSRMVPEKEQKAQIKEVLSGSVDLIIGTHRLLSKEIQFKDLGLLVVDEEQRFGVEQKEAIKEMKKSVDVLTLSATPIPRTMQMSLVGIRAMSTINTPPEFRMPIQTYVTPYDEKIAIELIQRELGRGGQVFYLFNNTTTIYSKASQIARKIPNSTVGVVHGKLDKEEVEETMSKFYEGKIDVLVCTSIVENGIDVPNANMIIVENADKFGLSQLYQIKGRVGRGNRIAYAYLFYNPYKDMNEEAQKRLKAIQEFTELGSGYKIAQRDLLIRGAGDILGPEQAGFIDSIGLDLYLKMLNEAIEEKTTGKKPKPIKVHKMFNIDAYIPKEYAINSDKIELYQELQEIENESQLSKFVSHIRDVYGRLPDEVNLLIEKKKIDLLLDNEEFVDVSESEEYVDILLSSQFARIGGIGVELFNQLMPYINLIKVTFINKELNIRMKKNDEWIKRVYDILMIIHRLYMNKNSVS